jgi:hypothetical protein
MQLCRAHRRHCYQHRVETFQSDFAIGIPRYSRESITSYLTQRGATPLQGDFAGLHIKDPDGVNVQISSQT